MDSKELIEVKSLPKRRGCSRIALSITGTIVAIIVIGLAVGLGVGLTRNNDNDMSTSTTTPSISSTPGPSISGNSSNLWQPAVNSSWQIVLLSPLQLDLNANTIQPDVDIFDIDMFTNSNATIDHLQNLNKKVICYFSAGTYEPNRPDSAQFKPDDLGTELPDWPGEFWLNLNSQNVRNIMANRIQTAHEKNCDGIDPDNVDGYVCDDYQAERNALTNVQNNNNGLNLTTDDSVNFVQFLSQEAAQYNIATGLKNAAAIIPQVLNITAFNVNEQCVQYSECSKFDGYINAGKPVFHIEYPKNDNNNNNASISQDTLAGLCQNTGMAQGSYEYSTIIKNMDLNGWVQLCNDSDYFTPTVPSDSS